MARTLGAFLADVARLTPLQVPDLGAAAGAGVAAIAYDSRTVGPGAVFVALRGTQRDGAAFAAQAIGNGAIAIIADGPAPDGVDVPWVVSLRCETTTLCVAAERGALIALEGSCKTPIGAHAWLEGGALKLVVEALSPDGRHRFRRSGEAELSQLSDPPATAHPHGVSLGAALKAEAGDAIVL